MAFFVSNMVFAFVPFMAFAVCWCSDNLKRRITCLNLVICTCIRTERIRKLNFHAVKCGYLACVHS